MIAWERAFLQVAGGRAFPAVRPDGLTDHQIAAWLLGSLSPTATEGAVAHLVGRYEAELAGALPLRQGRVLDNVRSVLEWVRLERPSWLSWLVTGNTRAGGTAKLRHYGLDEWFQAAGANVEAGSSQEGCVLQGAFSSRVEPRANIVRRALELAQQQVPGLGADDALVIGDTPHDIEGAHAIGVPVLAVATNTHSLEELASHRPWRAVPVLPGRDEFAALVSGR
jgi:phosphoglycolate phosphatase-like HAD superfamily hydrolase